jgi:hypothetical protein
MTETKTEAREDGSTTTELLLTTDEAVEWIRKAPRATRFCIMVRIDTPCVGEDGERTGRYFADGACSHVTVPGRVALEVVRGGLSKVLEGRGARWRVRSDVYKILDKRRVTYWIG